MLPLTARPCAAGRISGPGWKRRHRDAYCTETWGRKVHFGSRCLGTACDERLDGPTAGLPGCPTMAQATFFYDLGSPFAYLAAERLDAVLPAPVAWQPVSLGALFKLTG